MSKILVVDQEAESLDVVRESLTRQGHEVFTATNAMDGLRSLAKNHPDAVVTEVDLPDMPGLDLCRKIKQHAECSSTPVIFFSNHTKVADIDSGFDAGASEYLIKPLRGRRFMEKLQRVLDGSTVAPSLEKPADNMREHMMKALSKTRPLGDIATIFPGITTGNNRKHIAEVQRGPTWKPVLLEHSLARYGLSFKGDHLRVEPRRLLRVPDLDLFQWEKVVLRRSAPPLTAAIDRDGFYTEMSVYNILPGESILLEYVTAVLNSKVMEFYITHIAPPDSPVTNMSLLRLQDVKDLPFIVPDKNTQHTIAILVNRVHMLQDSFYTSNQRIKICETTRLIDEKIAELYGMPARIAR